MADMEQMLHELLSKIAKEQNYEDATITLEAASDIEAHYLSVIYNASISAPNKKELQLFAKVGNLTEKTREVIPAFIFDTERFVYQDLAEIFKRIEQNADVPEEHRYVFPKVYGCNTNIYEETIIMENLAVKRYDVYDRFKSIDWPYASKAVETLAKFHALAMAYDEQNPEEYQELLNRLTNQTNAVYKKLSDKFVGFISIALAVTREENKERLQKYFDELTATDRNVFRFTKPKSKAVLVHGDYRPCNIMYKVTENGTIDLIPVDYQTITGGCGVSDLLYFIFGGSDAEFRSKYYQRMVDHYYNSLSCALERLRLDPTKIYSREHFDFDLRETLPYGLVSALMLLPIVTVESQHAPDLNDNCFESIAQVTAGPLYPSRVNGVIDDFIKFGIL